MRWVLIAAMCVTAVPSFAQDREQTLADIRQELSVLYVEIQRLRRELSTTGGVNSNLSGTNVLERVDSLEAEVQRLTAANEALTNRVDRIVSDGTNRIGDLEFRLVELEGGDLSTLGENVVAGGRGLCGQLEARFLSELSCRGSSKGGKRLEEVSTQHHAGFFPRQGWDLNQPAM